MDTTGLLEPDFNDDEMFSYNPMWKCNLDATYAAFQREKSEKKRSLSPVNDVGTPSNRKLTVES